LPKPRFEAKVPFGDILSFLVRRQNVAKNVGKIGVFSWLPGYQRRDSSPGTSAADKISCAKKTFHYLIYPCAVGC